MKSLRTAATQSMKQELDKEYDKAGDELDLCRVLRC